MPERLCLCSTGPDQDHDVDETEEHVVLSQAVESLEPVSPEEVAGEEEPHAHEQGQAEDRPPLSGRRQKHRCDADRVEDHRSRRSDETAVVLPLFPDEAQELNHKANHEVGEQEVGHEVGREGLPETGPGLLDRPLIAQDVGVDLRRVCVSNIVEDEPDACQESTCRSRGVREIDHDVRDQRQLAPLGGLAEGVLGRVTHVRHVQRIHHVEPHQRESNPGVVEEDCRDEHRRSEEKSQGLCRRALRGVVHPTLSRLQLEIPRTNPPGGKRHDRQEED